MTYPRASLGHTRPVTHWRTGATVSLLGLALVSCGPSPGPIASTQASPTYELVCGDMPPLECEEATAAFAADILESNPEVSIVRISFSFGMIDAERSNGIHISSHLEPPAGVDN